MEAGERTERPLLGGLVCCVAGGLAAAVVGVWGALLAALALWPLLRAAERRWGLAGAWWGLAPATCSLLVGVAALRAAPAPPTDRPWLEGRWHTVREGAELVGRLEPGAPLFELPPGAAREGEWLHLLPTASPPQPARGPVPPPRRDAAQLPLPVDLDEIVRLRPPPAGPFSTARRAVGELRRAGIAHLAALEEESTRGLAGALLFGDRSELEPELADLFTRTGTRHALAISGLHVTLVASLWIFPVGSLLAAALRRLLGKRAPEWLRRPAVWRALLLALFVPVAGAGAPVVRAALALALSQLAGLVPLRRGEPLRRRADALSLWALAGWIEWLASPESLRSVSVQLSYSATLGLIVLAPPMLRRVHALLPAGGRLDPTDRLGHRRPLLLRILAQKALDWALAGLSASVAANLATLPIVWWTFGEWSPVGSVATLLLLPLLGGFIGLAWLWMLCPFAPLERGLELLARGMTSTLELLDSLPGTPLPLPERPGWLLLAAGALLLARPLPRRALGLAWGTLLLPWSGTARQLTVDLLDVGHGTALVLRAPGEPCWVFDAGSRDRPGVARQALFPLLRRLDPGRVAVVLSHSERDHAGALPWLVERFPPAVWAGALPSRIACRLPSDCPRVDLETGCLELDHRSGAAVPLRMRLLRGERGAGNEGSRSLEVSWGGHRLLLCGDAEEVGLRRTLERHEVEGPVSLLLLPHHGSECDYLGELLRAVRPEEVWVSCGEEPAVARELDRRALPWLATAGVGPLRRTLEVRALPP